MRFPEGYCWWCGTWQVLQYLDAVCGKCNKGKCGDEREANTWLPQLRGELDSKGRVPGQARTTVRGARGDPARYTKQRPSGAHAYTTVEPG